MTSLISRVDDYLIGLLNPLAGIVTHSAFRVEQFDSPETISELLGNFRDETPAGFLSIPSVNFITPDSTTRIPGVTLEYGVLIGYARARETNQEARLRAYRDFDLITSACIHQKPNAAQFPPSLATVDFVRPSRWQLVIREDRCAALLNFSVRISRWNIQQS
jgi:hypothetical protein